MASGCITEHGPTLTGSNPEGETFPHLWPLTAQSLGDPTVTCNALGLSLRLRKFQTVEHHPTDPTWQRRRVDLSPLSPSVTTVSPVWPLSIACAQGSVLLSHLSIT